MTTEQSAQALECPHCAGSGERQYMTQHLGPNDYEVTALCHDCNGSGEFKEPSTQAEWDRVYALVRHWSGRAERAEAWNRRHHPAAAQLEGWMTIESAPKDGTTVLLWEQYIDVPIVGHFSARHGKWYADTSNYDTDGNACVTDKIVQELLSHWQPLPPPPTQPKEQSK